MTAASAAGPPPALPDAPDGRTATTHVANSPQPERGVLRVLLVEDDALFRQTTARLLRSARPYAVLVEAVATLREGLERLEANAIDLVLLDLTLPDSSGLETLRAARAQAPDVPIVVLTGVEDEGVAVGALQAGAQDYVRKSDLDGAMLARAIRYAVERHRTETQRQEALAQLQELQRLRELDSAKTRMWSFVAHNLNTPLTPILAHLEMLRAGARGPLTAEQQRSLATIEANVGRLAEAVRELLDAARLDAGRLELRPEPFDLRPVLMSLFETFSPLANRRGVRLQVDGGGPLDAYGDAERLMQVLENLLDNALKFTPSGGTVTLEAARAPGGVRLTVTDTGVGLAPDQVRALFRPFAQPVEPVHRERPGNGIGLYMCKLLVEAHGGRMTADSAGPGQGSRFIVELPTDGTTLEPSG